MDDIAALLALSRDNQELIVDEWCYTVWHDTALDGDSWARAVGTQGPRKVDTAETYVPRVGDDVCEPVDQEVIDRLRDSGYLDQAFFHTERNAALAAFTAKFGHPPLLPARAGQRAQRWFKDPVLALTERDIRDQHHAVYARRLLVAYANIARGIGVVGPVTDASKSLARHAADRTYTQALKALDVEPGTPVLRPGNVHSPSTYNLKPAGAVVVSQLRQLKLALRAKAEEAVAGRKRKAASDKKRDAKRQDRATRHAHDIRSPEHTSGRLGLRNSPPVAPSIAELTRIARTGILPA